MCDPVTLGIAAATGVASKLVSGSEAVNAAKREAAARNAVLQATLEKERGYAADNAGQLEGNIAHYAPGSQQAQLEGAQNGRIATSTGNLTQTDPNSIPVTSDAPPAVRGEIAKRLVAAHSGVLDRAKLTGKLGGFGDTWLANNLRTSEADRNIGVTNNFANGQKAILEPMQDAAAASVYKPPSIWSTILGGASGIAAGKAGQGVWKNPFGGGGAAGMSPADAFAGGMAPM